MATIRNKIIIITIVCALLLCLAVLTAPFGIPAMGSLLQMETGTVTANLSILFDGDVLADWQAYIFDVLSKPDYLISLAAWWGVIILVTLTVALVNMGNKTEREVNGGVLGDSKIVKSMKEIRVRNDFWNGKGIPKSAGLVFGSSRKGYIYEHSVPHVVIVGKTGSGKSQFMVIPTIHIALAAGWNLIVSGKPELLELTGEKVADLGYNRAVFDFKGYPGASHYNPLGLVIEDIELGQVDKAQRDARQIAKDLIPLAGEENSFFSKSARNILTGLILVVCCADIPRDEKNMSSVCNLINTGATGPANDPSAPLKEYLIAEVGPGHPAFDSLSELNADGGVTVAGKNVLSTLKEALSIFSDVGIARLTSCSDVSIRDMVRNKTIVYMHILPEGDPYLVLFTVFLNQWWAVAQEEARNNGGCVPIETALLLDELGNLPTIASLPEMVTLARSYKVHIYGIVQNLKQLNKYSKPGEGNAGRDTLLGSMGIKVALSLAGDDDGRYFSSIVGKHTVRTQSKSTSTRYASQGTSSTSESYSEHADYLIHDWEWQQRVPVRDGLICVKGGENSCPGREGVFNTKVAYASDTPARDFFGLGTPEENRVKSISFYEQMKQAEVARDNEPIPSWVPDFEAHKTASSNTGDVASDEWSAWDGR